MKRVRQYYIRTLIIVTLLLCSATMASAVITIQDVTPVNVTPSGFSVIWQTSEPAAPGIVVYSDPGGVTDITDQLEITPLPLDSGNPGIPGEYDRDVDIAAIRSRAANNGLMMIRVEGGQPDTTYYYKILSEGAVGTIVQWPQDASLLPVTTMSENGFIVDSRQMLLTIDTLGGTVNPLGWIVTASSAGALFGVSSYVGDGTPPNQAFINLNNLFGADGTNWVPNVTTGINLEIRRGFGSGVILKTFTIPFASSFTVSALHVVTADELLTDTDGDQIPDSWETANGLNPLDAADALLNYDSDTLTNLAEYQNGTNPRNPDTDGDGLPDGWEVNNATDPNDDGTINPYNGASGDPDGDTATNLEERQAGSNPRDGNSLPVNVVIELKKGLNFFGYPVTKSVGLTSYDLLVELGDATEIQQLFIFDPTTGAYSETHYGGTGAPAGDNVSIQYGDGINVYALVDKTVTYTPTARPFDSFIQCLPVALTAGLNVATFPCIPTAMTAYQLLQSIGNDTVISSIGRFNTLTGMFETAAYLNGQPTGSDFSIKAGEGYLIFMRQDVTGFRP